MRISELPSLWQTRSSNSAPSRFSSASFKVVNPSEVWFLWFITTKVVSVSYIVCAPFWVGGYLPMCLDASFWATCKAVGAS